MTDPLTDLYRKQRDLERLIADKKQRRQEGWAEMVQQHTDELNKVIEFRDGITTHLGGLNRDRAFPARRERMSVDNPATITPDERVKIDEFIRTKGVTHCESAAAEGAYPDLENDGDCPLTLA